jgi:hypothetical protein
MTTFSSPDVMRFLGKRVPKTGAVHACFEGQVVSDLKVRQEGIRIKHRMDKNSIKLYDKWVNLRGECTLNDPGDFKVYRPKEGDEDGELAWRPLRQGIADLHRRAQVSDAAVNRYFDAMAAVDATPPLRELTKDLCQPTSWNGKRVRALNPWGPDDAALLKAVNHGEFAINGFRNRDIRNLLFPSASSSPNEERRRSGVVTRKLRLLRAHGLIAKVHKTQRYQLTSRGRLVITSLLTAHEANADCLTKIAA